MKLLFIIFLIYFHGVVSQTATCDDSESKLAAITKFICNSTTNVNGPKGCHQFWFILVNLNKKLNKKFWKRNINLKSLFLKQLENLKVKSMF